MNPAGVAKEIAALLASKRFSPRDVRAFLFVAFATLGSKAGELTPEILEAIGIEAIVIGLRPGMSPAEMARLIREHYRAQPIDPALKREINALLIAATADGYRPSRQTAKLLGSIAR